MRGARSAGRDDRAYRNRPLTKPARRHAGLTRFFFERANRVLIVFDDLAQTSELGHGFFTVLADEGALRRVVSGGKLRCERVDAALQRFRIQAIAPELLG